ncbi:MAG: MotA/TolQ/ExbB proton channel family protein [Chlamydiota bacterium]
MMKKMTMLGLLAALLITGISYADTTLASDPETVITSSLNLKEVFQAAPIIYSILLLLSLTSFILWLYSLLTLRTSDMLPNEFLTKVQDKINSNDFEEALELCQQDDNFVAPIIAKGLQNRKHGTQMIMEAIQFEGRRAGATLWQRLSLLNDIVAVAPMFGLLGTVLGMFYAFYDSHRTQESIASIFDGLGMAIGTTVAGLIVAILAMIFHTTLKLKIGRLLNTVEHEALTFGNQIALQSITVNDPEIKE